MDPDAEVSFTYKQVEQTTSIIFKTTITSVVLYACTNYDNNTNTNAVKTILQTFPKDSIASQVIIAKPKKEKTIYLTFDDGPNKGTKNVCKILEEEKVNATFFIIGEQVAGSRMQSQVYDSLKKCPYVEIANHSYTHASNKFLKFYSSPSFVVDDFEMCANSLNLTDNIVRTPGRNVWRTFAINKTDINTTTEAADSLKENGYTVVGWDVEWKFNNHLKLTETTGEMLQKIDSAFAKNTTETKNSLVLLAHDQAFADAKDSGSLRNFIIQLKAKNEYNFEFIKDYPLLKN